MPLARARRAHRGAIAVNDHRPAARRARPLEPRLHFAAGMQNQLVPTTSDKAPARANNEKKGAIGIALIVYLLGGSLGLAVLVFLMAKAC